MRIAVFLILIFSHFTTIGQVMNDMEIDPKKLSGWNATSLSEYEGVYFFGISEGESQFIISIDGDIICAQQESFEWVELEPGKSDWRKRFTKFSNVKIVGNKFYSDEYDGEFVLYKDGEAPVKGLKIAFDAKDIASFEVGTYSDDGYLKYFEGKYPITKFQIMTEEDLKKYDPKELPIIRNEIFARYQYMFKVGGEMDKYFSRQEWYIAERDNVGDMINEIEKRNIVVLHDYEKKLKNK